MGLSHRLVYDLSGDSQRTAELLEGGDFVCVLLDLLLDLGARAEAAKAGATARAKALDSKIEVP